MAGNLTIHALILYGDEAFDFVCSKSHLQLTISDEADLNGLKRSYTLIRNLSNLIVTCHMVLLNELSSADLPSSMLFETRWLRKNK